MILYFYTLYDLPIFIDESQSDTFCTVLSLLYPSLYLEGERKRKNNNIVVLKLILCDSTFLYTLRFNHLHWWINIWLLLYCPFSISIPLYTRRKRERHCCTKVDTLWLYFFTHFKIYPFSLMNLNLSPFVLIFLFFYPSLY